MTQTFTKRTFLISTAHYTAVLTGLSLTAHHVHAATMHDIQITDFEFVPKIVSVKPGDTLRWTNHDIAPHTATALDGSWDTGELKRGESTEVLVTSDMSLDYFCAFHPHMKAALKML